MSDEKVARTLHQDALVLDSHNDSIVSHIRRGNQSIADESRKQRGRHSGTVAFLRGRLGPAKDIELNIPKMKEGGVDAAFFAVDVTLAWKNHLAYALDAFGFFKAEVEANSDDILIARTAGDIIRAKSEGKIAAVLVIENSEGVERSLNVLAMLHEVGVRSITLTHNLNTWAGAGNEEHDSGGGLTHFGEDLVREMNLLGILVDVSHVSERMFFDALEVTEKPVIASHSNSKAICDHPRNLSDEQIKVLAESGGSIGITFVPPFIDDNEPSLERMLDHIDHIVEQVGDDHVGLGSDFDGGGDMFKDATEYPTITDALLARGYSAESVRKILGGNHLRVFEQACGS